MESREDAPGATARRAGLPNLNGVVCYLNASTQSLIHGAKGGFEALARYAVNRDADRPVVLVLSEALASLRAAGHGARGPAGSETSDGLSCAFAATFAQNSNFDADQRQDAA